MKALSIRQPHAAHICDGSKTIELRSWQTKYRGDVLIVASKFKAPGTEEMPKGVAVCLARIVDCRPFMPEDAKAARSEWRPGLWAFVLEGVRPVPQVAVVGKLFLFDVPEPVHGADSKLNISQN